MARLSRLVFPGVALHIIQRGNNRNACFREDSDYLTYLAQLRQLTTKHRCDLHAYCLMTNHVHLLLTPQHADACSLLMRDLGRSYVQYFNRRHARSGTLWEGRFRSCLVESTSYVIACHRYIELNPIRAGMVDDPSAHPWSSHAANIGLRPDPGLTAHCEFLALSSRSPHASYRGLFDDALDDRMVRAIRDATNGGYPLASESFKASRLAALGLRTQPGKPGPRTQSKRIIADLTPN
jgi:putative transposase